MQGSGYVIVNKIAKNYSTRKTITTNSILDHICTNVKYNSFNMSIIESALSDHKHIFLEISSLKPQVNNKLKYRALDIVSYTVTQ